MLDPKLDTLLTVAETLNFTQSAEILSLTQPAVSQHIKQLEKELNIKIFNRENKGLKLTDEGKIAVNYAKRIRSVYANMRRDLEDEKHSIKRLTIGVTPTAENNIISQILAVYCSENPNIHITIISDTIRNIYNKLKSYEINIAIVEGNIVDSSYKSILLDTDCLILAVSNDNPLSRKEIVTLDELKKEKLILRLPDSGTRTLFESTLISKSESMDSYNIILEVDNNATIKDLVRNNFGVSIISRNACMEDVKRNRFKVLPIENISMMREINMVYHQDFDHAGVLDEIVKIYHETVRRI
ncbi:LysR family transcriptional regulator [Anaerolentibacter hominis]|uniref:LysR family transcriptional regulator n=1 Tax=Anaerolentibacter hominis TaxID=3079009 RepID=UPI0031B854B2